jgi:hypothetical protein
MAARHSLKVVMDMDSGHLSLIDNVFDSVGIAGMEIPRDWGQRPELA